MGLFGSSKTSFPVEGRTFLVTGGSQGMGLAVGKLLASEGGNVTIVARSVDKLRSAVEEIRSSAKSPSQTFRFISADLTSSAEVQRMFAEASSTPAGPPDSVFCCAGSAHPGYFTDLPASTLESQIHTNYLSAAFTAHAACRAWLSSSSNTPTDPIPHHIIFTSSLLAFLPLAGYTPYTPAKAALRALSESLAQELQLYRPSVSISMHCVFPGTIYSPGFEHETQLKPAITKTLEEGDEGQTPEAVAKATLKGLRREERSVLTGGLLGRAMRAGMLGAGLADGGLLGAGFDWLLSCVVGIVLAVVRWDMDGKVRKYGEEHAAELGKHGQRKA